MTVKSLLPIKSVLLTFFLGMPVTGQAVANPSLAGKYAVVDMQTIILSVEEGKEARAKLEKEIRKKDKEFKKAKAELDKLNQAWKQQAPLLSESARMEKQKEFQEKFLGLRNEEMTFQAEIKRKEQKVTQKIAGRITKVVSSLAAKRGYDMVFETNSSGLLYLRDSIDLTSEVIEIFEKGSSENKSGETAKKN